MNKSIFRYMLLISIIFGTIIFNLSNIYASEESYYSKDNAPEFYGLTKAVIQKGDSFSVKDAKFRIFARDFEDGDLTNAIVIKSNNVNTSEVGNYAVEYEVKDCDNNKTCLKVEIEVTADSSKGRYYERTLYSLPSVSNMSLAGTNRGNNEDRQMLGLYMESNSKISVKKISGDKDLSLTYLNNNSKTETSYTIKNDFVDVSYSYEGVPFIKTTYESKEPVVVGIKVEDSSNIYSLPYYHYGDDEEEFFKYWESINDSYAVTENEDVCVLIPYYDRDKLVNYFKNCFHTLDEFFEFWHNVMNQYDEYLGLSYNPEDPIDQNVKTQYFVKANISGVGSAYYAWDHVGINSKSVSSFFEVNWGGLHEVGHGYQGSLSSDLEQGEVSNNILGHYVQMNKSFYPYDLDWLGKISKIEDSYQSVRISGGSYSDLSVSGKLYFVVNLLDLKDPKETYATINKIWRRALKNNENITSMDAYVLAYYQLYNINIVPYFDSWNLEVSSKVKEKVSDGDTISMIYDVAKDKSDEIKSDLSKDGKYSLVTNKELEKYSLKGNLNIKLNIDNIDELKGKKILVKNECYKKELVIEDENIFLENIPAGTYEITLPVPKNNIYEYEKFNYVVISNKETITLNFKYKNSKLTDLTNDTEIELRGLGDQLFADITLKNKVLTLTTYATQPHVYYNENLYAKVEIYDLNDNIVYSKEYNGNEKYSKEIKEIPYEEGYKIVILHKEGNGRLVVKSTILNQIEKNIATLRDEANIYIIGKYGLYQEGQDDYTNYLGKIDDYVSKLKNDLTESEILNKNLASEEKRVLLLSINKLEEKEKCEYLKKYQTIYNGSFPELVKTTFEFKQNEQIDLYKILKGIDLEDGEYSLNQNNLKFDKDLVNNLLPGKYKIPYEIIDSDGNSTSGIINLSILKSENNSSEGNNEKNDESNNEKNDEIKSDVTNKNDETSSDVVIKNEIVQSDKEETNNNISENIQTEKLENESILNDKTENTEENDFIEKENELNLESSEEVQNEVKESSKPNIIIIIVIGSICIVVLALIIGNIIKKKTKM